MPHIVRRHRRRGRGIGSIYVSMGQVQFKHVHNGKQIKKKWSYGKSRTLDEAKKLAEEFQMSLFG